MSWRIETHLLNFIKKVSFNCTGPRRLTVIPAPDVMHTDQSEAERTREADVYSDMALLFVNSIKRKWKSNQVTFHSEEKEKEFHFAFLPPSTNENGIV